MPKPVPTVATVVLGLVVAGGCRRDPPDLGSLLARHGLVVGGAVCFAASPEVLELPGPGAIAVTAHGDGWILKVRLTALVSPAQAARAMADRAALLESLFDPGLPPYPEFLTRETGCPEPFRPQLREAPWGPYRLLFAGERLGFGVCVDDLVRYRAAVADVYCRDSGRVFSLEYFVPAGTPDRELEELMEGIACGGPNLSAPAATSGPSSSGAGRARKGVRR